MKLLYILFLSLIITASFYAQNNFVFEKKMQLIQDTWLNRQISRNDINNYPDLLPISNESSFPDTINTSLTDTMKYNMYGNLLNDDPNYTPKLPVWKPAVQIVIQEALLNLVDHYVMHFDWATVGFKSWNKTVFHSGFPWNNGWEWDNARFGNDFLLHPYTGASYFNAARSSGYNYWESSLFVFGGSYLWKLFGENGGAQYKPAKNSLVATTLGGMVMGEGLYRLGSDVIDTRSTGLERVSREFLAFIISPGRSFSRFLSGKLFDHTTEDVYQTEPLNITFAPGYHRVNDGTSLEQGSNSFNLNINLDYGNPFEKISRKPFDYYRVGADLDFGVGRKIADNITGYGILYGSNIQNGGVESLAGLFQHMDYFDNKTFELATFAFGPGIISLIPLSHNSSLYTNLHVSIVPFGALSNRFGPDTTQIGDFDFDGGAQITLQSTYNIAGWVGLTFTGYYWWLHTYHGTAGNSYIGLIKPRIAVKIYDNMSIGFEQLVYYSDRYPRSYTSVHSVRTEEKVFFQLFIEQFKFKK
jgi:hypothetical protein